MSFAVQSSVCPLSPCRPVSVSPSPLSSCACWICAVVWVWCVSAVCGCVWLCVNVVVVVVVVCVCVCGVWCVVCGVWCVWERGRRERGTFHDVCFCFSKPLAFHNGFMVFCFSQLFQALFETSSYTSFTNRVHCAYTKKMENLNPCLRPTSMTCCGPRNLDTRIEYNNF